MSKPIVDKAEVSIDFPDKYYHGSFGRSSRFDVELDAQGLHISLDRPGEEQRHVGFHLHYHLFTAILAVAEVSVFDPCLCRVQCVALGVAASLRRLGHRLVQQRVLSRQATHGLLVQFHSRLPIAAKGVLFVQGRQPVPDQGPKAACRGLIHIEDFPYHGIAFRSG